MSEQKEDFALSKMPDGGYVCVQGAAVVQQYNAIVSRSVELGLDLRVPSKTTLELRDGDTMTRLEDDGTIGSGLAKVMLAGQFHTNLVREKSSVKESLEAALKARQEAEKAKKEAESRLQVSEVETARYKREAQTLKGVVEETSRELEETRTAAVDYMEETQKLQKENTAIKRKLEELLAARNRECSEAASKKPRNDP
jgi:hypothetical protein